MQLNIFIKCDGYELWCQFDGQLIYYVELFFAAQCCVLSPEAGSVCCAKDNFSLGMILCFGFLWVGNHVTQLLMNQCDV